MDTVEHQSENRDLKAALRAETTAEGHRILAYWRNQVLLEDGGFHGEVAGDGTPKVDAPRSLILAARILWTYSRAVTSGFEDSEVNRQVAHRTFDYLVRNFWDQEFLGFYWMITHEDEPLVRFKHVYGQAFAIYALSAYYQMSQRDEALKMAQFTYTLLQRHALDSVHGGFYEVFTEDWTLNEDLTDAPVNHGGPKSMNSHLHILEAFTALYQVWPSEVLRKQLTDVLDVMRLKVVNPATHQFHLFFHADWTPIGDVVSYGHDIEGSWLMLEAAEVLSDEERTEACRELAVRMTDAVIQDGVDEDGGVLNEGRGQGDLRTVLDGSKEWWQQAEAVVGCVNAYQVSADGRYLEKAWRVWQFIDGQLLDKVKGEWLIKVDRDRTANPQAPKVSAWKCPYHNARACMELFLRLSLPVF